MASIIFQNVIEKVNSASQNVSNYLNNIDTYILFKFFIKMVFSLKSDKA